MTARRFFTTLLITLLLAAGIDIAIGLLFDKLTTTALGGDTARHHYINNLSEDDIYIFGSSRAIAHYDTRILTDSLRLSAYNCGTDGNGTLLTYMMLSNILKRHTPKIVVIDLYPPYDLLPDPSPEKCLYWQREQYNRGNPEIDSLFIELSPSERYKMLSSAYRYNFRFIQIISDNISPKQTDFRGYRPTHGKFQSNFKKPAPPDFSQIDPVKIKYLKKLLVRCREAGIRTFAVISPYYFPGQGGKLPSEITSMLDSLHVTLLDYSEMPEVIENGAYFSDTNHMNQAGSKLFSQKLAQKIHEVTCGKSSIKEKQIK